MKSLPTGKNKLLRVTAQKQEKADGCLALDAIWI